MAASAKDFVDKVHSFIGESHGPYLSWDPVNLPMIRHLAEALGDDNPNYTSPEYAASSIHGGIVAVNCEQEYSRYLKPGDRIYYRVIIDDISDEKSTALGPGFFVNQQYTFYDYEDEPVGKMLFRTLRYKPEKS